MVSFYTSLFKYNRHGRAFLHTELDEGDATYFILYHADILQKAVKRLAAFVRRKQDEVTALEKSLSGRKGADAFNHRVSWLLNEFARNRLARITVEEHQMRHGVSYLTARADLEDLTARRYLKKRKEGKFSIYEPARDFMKKLARS